MLCINNLHTDPYFNLAAEEYLLKNFSKDVFMLWQNDSSVIVGKHQDVPSEVNLEFVRDHQILVARRYSGGGAVYHDSGNVNLTFIESGNNPDFTKYTRLIQDILLKIGIYTQANERNALFINGLKISGSAQYIRKDRLLFHASLLFSTNLAALETTLDSRSANPEEHLQALSRKSVKSVKSPVTNISDHLSAPLSIQDFKNLVIHFILNDKKGNSSYAFSNEDLSAIRKLKKEKYATTDWNVHALSMKKIVLHSKPKENVNI